MERHHVPETLGYLSPMVSYSLSFENHSSQYGLILDPTVQIKKAADQYVMMKLLHQPLLLTFMEVCQTSGLQTWLTNFSFNCMQSQYFSILFVVYLSGVSRATLSCSLRPSARSSSSQTSRPSPPILMSCMRVPKISLEDRCVLQSMTLFIFFFQCIIIII